MKQITGKLPEGTSEVAALRELMGKECRLHGYIHRIRRMKGFAFVIIRCARDLVQCVANDDTVGFVGLTEGMTVYVTGCVRAEERNAVGFEIDATGFEICSSPDRELPFVMNKKELNIALDTNLDFRSVSLRHPQQRAIFRIQNALVEGFRSFFSQMRFVEIRTPKLVFAGAEGGANIFKIDYFGRDAYLAQSPQFYKQAMVGVFERVFEVGPVYRAEKHATSRHLNEYVSLDVEMGFIDGFEDLMVLETAMLQHMMTHVQATAQEELVLLGAVVPTISFIPSIKFTEAKELAAARLGTIDEERDDLSPNEEIAICDAIREQTGSEFVFVTHYPETKRPFYAMEDPLNPLETLSFDLLFRGLEVTTGGQRIHDAAKQIEKLERRGMQVDLFESYLQIHHAGMPPHGGFGAGLERLTMKLLDLPNIRYASLYPRDIGRLEP